MCLVGIAYLLYSQFTSGKGIMAIQSLFQGSNNSLKPAFLLITIFLMPINWWLEAFKFKKLMSPHLNISTRHATATVLAGIAAGIVTPGRVGEYAGRLLTSDSDRKTEVISATLLGSIAQNLCNIVVGLLFSYFFLKSTIDVTYDNTFTFVTLVTIQVVLLVSIYYHLPQVAHFMERFLGNRYIHSISPKLKALDLYKNSLLNVVLGISAVRYLIYFLQYLCIMKFLGVESSFTDLAGNISGIYMIQTGIPLPAFLSVMARGELAVLVWAGIGVDSITALGATFSLWCINLVIPTLVGMAIILASDLKKYVK